MHDHFWTVPNWFQDQDVFVIGAGWSLLDMTPAQKAALATKPTIALNRSFDFIPRPNIIHWSDLNFFETNRARLERSKATLVTVCGLSWRRSPDRVRRLEVPKRRGLARKPWQVHSGRTSGHTGLNLAYHLGARRIVLLGYDMGPRADGRLHWHSDVPADVPETYALMIPEFDLIARELAIEGVEVVNASPDSRLPQFPKATFADVLGEDEPADDGGKTITPKRKGKRK